LHEGDTKLFHLKQGDKKVFMFKPDENKIVDFVNIISFNLKMTTYNMNVDIVKNQQNLGEMKGVVTPDWIGGQQFKMTKNDLGFDKENLYRITILAKENGIFNIEARTSNTVVKLSENIIKFDSLKQNQRTCYKYVIGKDLSKDDLIIKLNVIKGKTDFMLSPNNIPNLDKDFPINFRVTNNQKNYELPAEYRENLKGGSGIWFVCAVNKNSPSLYTIQVYMKQFEESNKIFEKNLITLIKNDDSFNLDNNDLNYRVLSQNKIPRITQMTTVNAPTNTTTTTISINGYGVAGIFSFIFLLVTVVIAISCMDSIFVSTKFVEHPLLLGKVEN